MYEIDATIETGGKFQIKLPCEEYCDNCHCHIKCVNVDVVIITAKLNMKMTFAVGNKVHFLHDM